MQGSEAAVGTDSLLYTKGYKRGAKGPSESWGSSVWSQAIRRLRLVHADPALGGS